jgi:glutamine synthetase
MVGAITLEELRTAAERGEIDTVVAAQVDLQGRLMGKRFQVEFFLDSAFEETHSCNYLQATDMEMNPVDGYQATSWAHGYGDYVMRPDLATLRRIPWLEGTALVLCDVLHHHGHAAVAHSPRAVLQYQLARLEAQGTEAFFGSELEFFLFKQTFEQAHASGYTDLTPISPYNEDYHIFQTTKEEHVMRAVRTGLQGANVPVENSKGEADAGQAEINVRYADALTMADRHVIIKNAVKEIAYTKGHAVSFLAKWSNDAAGSSCHLHQSLADSTGTALFYDAGAEHGMSKLMRHYLAGLLHHARELTWFLAPYVNSYKRFVAGTFAPTKAIWSLDNRTAGFRVCADGTQAVRVECRIGGADLNPYLAMAALLAAGMSGIEQELELEAEFVGDAYGDGNTPYARAIPQTLREATQLLDESAMLRTAFGDQVIDHYVHTARHEQATFDRAVTDWELKRGFERA